MATLPPGTGIGAPPRTDMENNGLRFINEEWNGSIANSEPFTLKWNESVQEEFGQLKLFKVTYPNDGAVAFELVSNLTDIMGNIGCVWTPEDLDIDDLYTLWLSEGGADDQSPSFAISPPWKLREPKHQGMHWTTPVGIPIVVILSLYFISLATCLAYRRRKRKQRERLKVAMEEEENRPPTATDTDAGERQNSVSSVETNSSAPTYSSSDPLVRRPGQARTPEKPYASRRDGGIWDRAVIRWNDGFEGTGGIRLVTNDDYHRPRKGSDAALLSSPARCEGCARKGPVAANDLDVERIGEAL